MKNVDKLDLCLITIDTVREYFQDQVNTWHDSLQFDVPRINFAVTEQAFDNYAELDTVDAFYEYTVSVNKLWMLEKNLDKELLVGIVAHECVHAFQMTRDAIEQFPSSGARNKSYWFCEYEIEARGYERAFVWLVEKKLKKLNKNSKKSS